MSKRYRDRANVRKIKPGDVQSTQVGESGPLPIWRWLVSCRQWSLVQGMAMCSIGFAVISLAWAWFQGYFQEMSWMQLRRFAGEMIVTRGLLFSDICVWISYLLVAVIIVLVVVRNHRSAASGRRLGEIKPQNPSSGSCCMPAWVFGLTVLVGVAFIYLTNPFSVTDLNPEAMDMPIVVGNFLKARDAGVGFDQHLEADPIMQHLKRINPQQVFDYFGGRFQFELLGHQAPTLGLFYLPFVSIWGVSNEAVALYSLSFFLLSILLIFICLARVMDTFSALSAILFLLGCTGLIIHQKIAYAAWMPSLFLLSIVELSIVWYSRRSVWWTLLPAAIALGFLYGIGWLSVVFGSMIMGFWLLLDNGTSLRQKLVHGLFVSMVALITAVVIIAFYASLFGCDLGDVHRSILDVMFGRYGGGSVPGFEPSFGHNLAYAVRCMFIDSVTMDHLDKCLEGVPALSRYLGVSAFVGLIYMIRDRSSSDRFLSAALLGVYALLMTRLTYTHRYALLGWPIIAAIGARGLWGLLRDITAVQKGWMFLFCFMIIASSLATMFSAYRNYYVGYVQNKPADFEVDRLRGHSAVVAWLNENVNHESDLVLLGDPFMFPHTSYVFDMFGDEHFFEYWSSVLSGAKTLDDCRAWEKSVFSERAIRKIVYVCSSGWGAGFNSIGVFLQVHPGMAPSFVYSYANRPPSIAVFEVQGP